MAAAVADYRPATVADDKIKKEGRRPFHPGGAHRGYPWHHRPPTRPTSSCAAFPWRPGILWKTLPRSLPRKNLDMVVANNLKVAGAGFGVDTNVVTFITPDGTRGAAFDEQGGCSRCHSGRDPAAAGKVILPGFCCTHITKFTKKIMVLSENSALPVYFMLQKLYNKSVSQYLEGIGLRCSRYLFGGVAFTMFMYTDYNQHLLDHVKRSTSSAAAAAACIR